MGGVGKGPAAESRCGDATDNNDMPRSNGQSNLSCLLISMFVFALLSFFHLPNRPLPFVVYGLGLFAGNGIWTRVRSSSSSRPFVEKNEFYISSTSGTSGGPLSENSGKNPFVMVYN